MRNAKRAPGVGARRGWEFSGSGMSVGRVLVGLGGVLGGGVEGPPDPVGELVTFGGFDPGGFLADVGADVQEAGEAFAVGLFGQFVFGFKGHGVSR